MAFLGAKQVLPDEIKIRELAEQISVKASQADPNGSELHDRLRHCLTSLQEDLQEQSLVGLRGRLAVMAQKYSLKFIAPQPHLLRIGPEIPNSFLFEIKAELSGEVSSVKLILAGAHSFEGEPPLVAGLQRWGFKGLEEHVLALHNLRSRLKGVDIASVFKILLATENILATVAKATVHSNSMDMILHGPIGCVTSRNLGLPMHLTIFASPHEFLTRPQLANSLCLLPEGFGFPLLVSMESSTQTYPLPADPNLFSLSSKTFQPLTPQNSITAPVTLLINFPREVPISAQTMFQIYRVVYVNEHAFQWPARRHCDEAIIRDWAKHNSCDPDTAAAPNTCHTVHLPSQCHRYFHGNKWLSGEIARQECGVALSKIPFLEPRQLIAIVQLLRQQLVYNCLYTSCCGTPPPLGGADAEGKTEYAFIVEGSPPGSIDITLDLLQEQAANVTFKITIPESKPFLPEVQVGLPGEGLSPNPILSKALAKCLSIPVLLYSALKQLHIFGPAVSAFISTYQSTAQPPPPPVVAVEMGTPAAKRTKLS